MNKVIARTKKESARTTLMVLYFLNYFATGLGCLSLIFGFLFLALGVIWWKVLLMIIACFVPAILLLLFKAAR